MPISLTNGKQIENWRILFRRRLELGAGWDIVQPVDIVQGDKNLPVLAATLTVNGQRYDAPSGTTFSLKVGQPGGMSVNISPLGVDSDGVVYFEFSPPLTSLHGEMRASVGVYLPDGGAKCSQLFDVHISRNPIPGGD